MRADASLRLFAHIAARPEAELDFVRAALLLAEPEYPDFDMTACLERIDALGVLALARLRPHGVMAQPSIAAQVGQLLDLFYRELGFRGNAEDYYDPRNSFLNEVVERRSGIPISLAIVLVEVGRRAGLRAHGVGFPGHFLVRFEDDTNGPIFVDPFLGRTLDEAAIEELAERAQGTKLGLDARAREPASKVNMLIRMLNNLRGIYSAKEDSARLRGILERLEVLAPSTELRRQIEALGGSATPPPRSRPSALH